MTELRYLPDQDDVTEFDATVETTGEDYVVLDGTYFYAESGGQPADHGTLEWSGGTADVVDVQKDHGDVKHYVENVDGALPGPGEQVHGQVDAERREQHRRMHTAQHVLSRVVLDEYDATTAGNQIHEDRSRIDFEPAEFDDGDVERIEQEANAVIQDDLPVEKKELPRDEVEGQVPDGRTNLDLIPDHVDPLRVVIIDDWDLCPCGGTHVDRLSDIGEINITDRVSKGADVERIEFELR
ncbi:MAG: alanyl-tRNA editing protein [Candidatus Nanohaloarchaea archaeon]|nr:alanyl-tRNA editing protein [Candidatus Nanohaloarchaea archaeon]